MNVAMLAPRQTASVRMVVALKPRSLRNSRKAARRSPARPCIGRCRMTARSARSGRLPGARAGCVALTTAPSASSTCAANVFQSGRPRCNSRQASASERPRERSASYASSSCAASSSTIWSSR